MRRFFFLALACAAAAPVGLPILKDSAADEPVTQQLYGGGVHAYFTKQYAEAHDLLNTAVDNKTEDPRVYYFRGLARWQLGRPDEAKQDFEAGATLEATASDDLYNIDKALERIQGKPRLAIEDARRAARNVAARKRITEKERRYNRIRANEPNILELPSPPTQAPEKKAEPPAGDNGTPAKTDEGAPKTAEPATATDDADILSEKLTPLTPRKVVGGSPKPAVPVVSKEPEPAPNEAGGNEPKVAAKAKAPPPGKKAIPALARILGRMVEDYANEVVNSVPTIPAPGDASPVPLPLPKAIP
jgi:tetratricopeptide (TPR) repeat protein